MKPARSGEKVANDSASEAENSRSNLTMAYKAKKPTTEQRKLVETMAAVGIPGESICRVIGVSGKTLRKHYRSELDLASTKANAEVAGFLFNSAKQGNVAAQIFWL